MGSDIGKPAAVGPQRSLLEARLSERVRDFRHLDGSYPRRGESAKEADDRNNGKRSKPRSDKCGVRRDRVGNRVVSLGGGGCRFRARWALAEMPALTMDM